MTYYYQFTRNHVTKPSSDQIDFWEDLSKKSNWRIVQLSNGYYQTEYTCRFNNDDWNDVTRRETIDGAEAAIDSSIEFYKRKLASSNGPTVVKTFEEE